MKTIQGTWNYADGTAVNGATLYLKLSQDAMVPSTAQIAPRVVAFQLTPSGAIPTGAQIWCNDELQPSGTFYYCSVIAPGGALIWGSEAYIIQGNSPINLNTLIPANSGNGVFFGPFILANPSGQQTITGFPLKVVSPFLIGSSQVIFGSGSPQGVFTGTVGDHYTDTATGNFWIKTSGTGNTGWTLFSSSGLTLQTNGVNNSTQTLLNIAAGSGILATESGGTVTIQASPQVNTASTTLTAAQLKALKATPVQLIPAPGAGSTILITHAAIYYKNVTTGYTLSGDANAVIGAYYGNQSASMVSGSYVEGLDIINNNILQSWMNMLTRTQNGVIMFPTFLGNPGVTGSLMQVTDNQPIMVAHVNNSGAELTVGDGTLTVTLWYSVVATP